MGKRLKQQRRGKGTPRYRAPSHRYKTDLKFRSYDDLEKAGVLVAKVLSFLDDPARTAPLMIVQYDNGERGCLIAPEGIAVGDEFHVGAQGQVRLGSVLPLYRIPEGLPVYNLELTPGDGGKLVRSAGSSATLVSKEGNVAYIKLPSRRTIAVSTECRAQIGVISGGGRVDVPLLKAGANYYKKKAQNKTWPVVRGVHQAAYDHPHGGKQHHAGKPTTISRGSPPGSKVGHLAARQTGRKKGKRTSKENR